MRILLQLKKPPLTNFLLGSQHVESVLELSEGFLYTVFQIAKMYRSSHNL